MACQVFSDLQLLTPAVAAQDYSTPLPPMQKVNASFNALPENELQVIGLPEITEDKTNSFFLNPKLRASKRKRLFDDMVLKMADQGSTKLHFFNRSKQETDESTEKNDSVAACAQELGYELPQKSASFGHKRRCVAPRIPRRRSSAACA